jgi:3alpha(or 20beta)-hydroxysteroid dehydrogenase
MVQGTAEGGTRLAGKTAIITGGARGQGEAEVRRFVAEGANVVIADLLDEPGAQLAAELGPNATYLHTDVTQEADWAKAVATAEAYGPLNVLVNNAAIHWVRPIEFETAEGLEKMWRVNALGPFLGMKAVLEPMRRAGGGSIVNISSTAGMLGYAYHGAYGHTKWALRGLSKVAAVEFGESGIRVNSVHPGPIKTTMLPDYENPAVDERFRRLPAGRAGEASEVAALVLFLASDESNFITGMEHIIDGGSTAGGPIPYRWDEATQSMKGL